MPLVFSELERILLPDEKIFTSMDVRPIDIGRIHSIDGVVDARILSDLQVLARSVYFEFISAHWSDWTSEPTLAAG